MLFCKHQWVFLKEHSAPSKVEEAHKQGIVVNKGYTSILYKEVVAIYTCSVCGKFKKVTTTNCG